MSLFDDLPAPKNNKVVKNEIVATINTPKRSLVPDSKHNFATKKSKIDKILFKSFVSARKGEREEMQDEHILIDDYIDYMKKHLDLNAISGDVYGYCPNRVLLVAMSLFGTRRSQCAIYGVYDGHSGCLASKFAVEHVHQYLAMMFPRGDCSDIENDIKKVFTDVYKKVDEEFLKLVIRQRPYLRDGSTAINVLLVNSTMYVAHIGDSKAVLARQLPDCPLTAISLTKDHTAIDYEERTRIQKLGSVVRDGRVNGLLEVSRSFGDYQYKKQGVISVPDVKKCRVTECDRFVIIACDGLWRSFTPLQAVQFVNDVVQSECDESVHRRYEIACSRLTSEAVLKMSGDNVTAVIVAFHV